MAAVLEPLKAAGSPAGPGVEMTGGDGVVRKVYPFLAAYVVDYPEQCLVACTKYGTCPKCRLKADLGQPQVRPVLSDGHIRSSEMHDYQHRVEVARVFMLVA